ncbi:hypothetical protein E2562_024590 [Oryza meyeriana var. granulata]|uniref:Uncharacterized protein n=1 Tax=Oryza meyeriana var. granulata TaxID=110450 RepID=A0A6G1DM61_9ORYZ|nr:hypothetical protein E2562_024590 [Oryza meyeriana var. granulata]
MHHVTERTIVETPALGPVAFAAVMPWESGHDTKEHMRRARIRFYPSHDDTEELRASLRHVLRIRVAAGATEPPGVGGWVRHSVGAVGQQQTSSGDCYTAVAPRRHT